jgi:RNA polymerase sigma-70 factor (ECF subfamily)
MAERAEPPRRFQTTRWTLVLAAGDRSSGDAEAALESLCESYWSPVYAFIRRSGHDAESAKDLTQGFFLKVMEKDFFSHARPERGRFRSFLLSSVKNFLANERDWARAAKRGGGRLPLSLEVQTAERTYQLDVADDTTPDRLYERRWALAVIGAALARLEQQYDTPGKRDQFARLKPFLTGNEPASYAELAAASGATEGALRVAVHRMRQHFATALHETIAETVDQPAEVDEELRYLLGAVSG